MFDEIPMPTEELFFLDVDTARMFAVEAPLISKARVGMPVYDAYVGLTSFHLSAWAEAHIHKTDGRTAASKLAFLRKSEKQRIAIQLPENNPQSVIMNEIFPVGQMVHEIMKGRTKEQAIKISQKTFTGTGDGRLLEE